MLSQISIKAVALNDDDFDSHLIRGLLRDRNKDYPGAIEDFNKCIAINPESPRSYFNRAFVKTKLRDRKGAIDDYSKSIELKPQQAPAYLNRAMVKQELDLHAEAIVDFDKALEIDKSLTEAIGNRGISKAMVNRKDAIDDFNLAIQLAPRDGEPYFNRALYYLNYKIKADYCADLKRAMSLGFTRAEEVKKEACK